MSQVEAPFLPAQSDLSLQRMSDQQYQQFAEAQVHESARQATLAGEIAESEALAIFRKRHQALLNDELRGTGHDFWVMRSNRPDGAAQRPQAWLWIAPPPTFLNLPEVNMAWLSQITVAQERRGKGVGRACLSLLDAQLTERGVSEIWLRVFDWNLSAQRLYKWAGYERVTKFEFDSHMRKVL